MKRIMIIITMSLISANVKSADSVSKDSVSKDSRSFASYLLENSQTAWTKKQAKGKHVSQVGVTATKACHKYLQSVVDIHSSEEDIIERLEKVGVDTLSPKHLKTNAAALGYYKTQERLIKQQASLRKKRAARQVPTATIVAEGRKQKEDARSVDDLVKFIEGASITSPPQKKSSGRK